MHVDSFSDVVEQQADPDGIVQGCMWENKRRFRQTQHTPFMIDPLHTRVGYLGIGRGAEETLNGTFDCPAEVSPHAARLIQGLRRINGMAETPIHTGMLISKYRQGWKRAREKTSAEHLPLLSATARPAPLTHALSNSRQQWPPFQCAPGMLISDGAKGRMCSYSKRRTASTFRNFKPLSSLRLISTLPTKQLDGKSAFKQKHTMGWHRSRAEAARIIGQLNSDLTSVSPWINSGSSSGRGCYAPTT
jgi:hypothetical protein